MNKIVEIINEHISYELFANVRFTTEYILIILFKYLYKLYYFTRVHFVYIYIYDQVHQDILIYYS